MYILFCWKTAEEHLEPMAGIVYHASWSLVLVACGPLNWPAATYAQILHSPDVQHQPQARKHTGPSDSCLVTANDIRPHPSCQKLVPSHWCNFFYQHDWPFFLPRFLADSRYLWVLDICVKKVDGAPKFLIKVLDHLRVQNQSVNTHDLEVNPNSGWRSHGFFEIALKMIVRVLFHFVP